MKKLYIFLFISIFFGCQKSEKPTYQKKAKVLVQEQHPGKKLMEMQCYACHNPSTKHDNRIAPPMIAVKNHYLTDGKTKEDFIKDIQQWINNPVNENVKMPGAVKKFGMMPRQYFSEKSIGQIAEYMYDNELEKPNDFENNHGNKVHGRSRMRKQTNEAKNNFINQTFEENGVKIALETKAVLGKNLMGKIQKEGTLAALEFCNVKAFSLTDSMSVAKSTTIKRVSDKPRNPKNKANFEEEKYIKIFSENAKNGIDSEPIVIESTKNVSVYSPIITNSMCLQCHGTPKKEVDDDTFTTIKKLYPSDKAMGYDINQVRGIWNITFTK